MQDFSQEFKKISEQICSNCKKCNKDFEQLIWDKIPETCHFEGWAFQKREEIKQKVRKQKERLLSLNVQLNNAENKELINEEISSIKKNIEKYEEYGSKDW